MTAAQLAVARHLLEVGAGCSARKVLGALRGSEANRLRLLAREVRLRPGFYALGVVEAGTAIVVPVSIESTVRRFTNVELQAVFEQASHLVSRFLGLPSTPSMRTEMELWLSSFGRSLGLPVALAMAAHLLPRHRVPRMPVVATGILAPDGSILPVEHLGVKVAAAIEELRGDDALVLGPSDSSFPVRSVANLEQAFALTFGSEPLVADARLLSLGALLEQAQGTLDHQMALALLEPLSAQTLSPADRARVELERSARLRHLGRTAEAAAANASAQNNRALAHRVLGVEAAERFELEHWLTRMDEFCLDDVTTALQERMTRPFAVLRNEVICRGMLAQSLAMSGRYLEAVSVRSENVALHSGEEWLQRSLPVTYCYLALDSAFAQDAAGFERFSAELVRATEPGDHYQWRYNAAALVRGGVALGRDRDAIEWSSGRSERFGHQAPEALVALSAGKGSINTHPEVSIVRALARAHWRTGASSRALDLLQCVPRAENHEKGLVAWLQELAHLERALALHHLGRKAEAAELARDVGSRLPELHPSATEAHSDLLRGELNMLANAVDKVWY